MRARAMRANGCLSFLKMSLEQAIADVRARIEHLQDFEKQISGLQLPCLLVARGSRNKRQRPLSGHAVKKGKKVKTLGDCRGALARPGSVR